MAGNPFTHGFKAKPDDDPKSDDACCEDCDQPKKKHMAKPYAELTVDAVTDVADFCASSADYERGSNRLFVPLQSFSEDSPPDWIPYLPKPGSYKHPKFGTIQITPARLARFRENFDKRIYQHPLPLDLEHQTKMSGAAAWITALRANEDGSVDAQVTWTDRGRTAMKRDLFRFVSPEWYDEWPDPMSTTVHHDILVGGAITNRPFFKAGALRPLVASESGMLYGDRPDGPDSYIFTGLVPVEGDTMSVPGGGTPPAVKVPPIVENTQPPEPEPAPVTTASEQQVDPRTFTEMQRQFAETQVQLKNATERVQALEHERQTTRFSEMAAGWHGSTDTHLEMLRYIATTAGEDSEIFKSYVEQQKSFTEQIRASNVFSEIGRVGRGVTGSAENRLQVAAETIRAASPEITAEQAYDRASKANPQLFGEVMLETTSPRRNGGS